MVLFVSETIMVQGLKAYGSVLLISFIKYLTELFPYFTVSYFGMTVLLFLNT